MYIPIRRDLGQKKIWQALPRFRGALLILSVPQCVGDNVSPTDLVCACPGEALPKSGSCHQFEFLIFIMAHGIWLWTYPKIKRQE